MIGSSVEADKIVLSLVRLSTPVTTRTAENREVDHRAAARAFVERVSERDVPGLERVYLFGSVPREEARGLDSDVDVLAIVSERTDTDPVRALLGDIAYDVMLAFGPVVEVHITSAERFDRRVEAGFPFERRVAAEGERVV
jgi:predicted nucleotidyltransferase